MKKTPTKNQNSITDNKSNTKNVLVGLGIVILLYLLWSVFPYFLMPAAPDTVEGCESLDDAYSRGNCFLGLAQQTQNHELCKEIDTAKGYDMTLLECLKSITNLPENVCDTFPESKKEDCFTSLAVSSYDRAICVKAPDPRQCEIIEILYEQDLKWPTGDVAELSSQDCEVIITSQPERNHCYKIVAQFFEPDGKLCDKIQDAQLKVECKLAAPSDEGCLSLPDEPEWPYNSKQNECFLQLALKTNNSGACTKMGDNYQSRRDSCYGFVASQTRNEVICLSIEDSATKESCINEVRDLVTYTIPESCETINDQVKKDNCYGRFADEVKSPDLCMNIVDITTKDQCLFNIATTLEICQFIVNEAQKQGCVEQVTATGS